jgi:hypothetical protein
MVLFFLLGTWELKLEIIQERENQEIERVIMVKSSMKYHITKGFCEVIKPGIV